MATLRNITVSIIEYRRDPTRPTINTVPLGIVRAFESHGMEMIAFRERSLFLPHELETFDAMHLRLLSTPHGYVYKHVRSALSGSPSIDEVFSRLEGSLRGAVVASQPIRLSIGKSAGTTTRQAHAQLEAQILAAIMSGVRPENLASSLPATKLAKHSSKPVLPHDPNEWWTPISEQRVAA